MPSDPACKRAKRCRSSVDLIVMRAAGEGAQLVDTCLVPGPFHQFDESVLALGGKRVGAVFAYVIGRNN
jgi:hypothetical protein